jgi:hypothetical protein
LETKNLGLNEFPQHGDDREFLLDLGLPTVVLLILEPVEFGDFGLLDFKLFIPLELSYEPLSP